MRKTRPAALAAALALVALLSACGGGDDDTADVATLGDDDTAATDDGTTETTVEASTDPQEAALAFAQCMRDHGIDMADPEISDGGGVAIAIGGEGDAGDIDQEALEAAHEACEPLMEAARPSEEDMPSDEEIQEMQDQALEAAQCMREHGYDWPDPVFQDGGGMTQAFTPDEEIDFDDEQFQADQQECMGGEGPILSGPGGIGGAPDGDGGDAQFGTSGGPSSAGGDE